ncbi:MAG: glycosyltransferase family 4 protein, partial [Synechococcaceae cyanobacterium]|nr:glycosyltransferase family 4 protein [Synechococcaceae cyanobacterium]
MNLAIGRPMLTLAGSALLSWLLVAALLPLLRRGLIDRPNERSAHRVPTPRGGGLAFVVVSCLWGGPPLLLACAPLAFVGFLDDRRDLPVALRYGVQLATAVGLLLLTGVPERPGIAALLLVMLQLVVITAAINFVNFTDGLDGLVASCSAVLFSVAALSLGAGWLWPLVGALLGFLVWNWSPARVFMGDVGSTFLGAAFAGVVLLEPTPARELALLLVGFPLLGDALVCVLRRLIAGQPVFRAHRLHLFQRLHRAGW